VGLHSIRTTAGVATPCLLTGHITFTLRLCAIISLCLRGLPHPARRTSSRKRLMDPSNGLQKIAMVLEYARRRSFLGGAWLSISLHLRYHSLHFLPVRCAFGRCAATILLWLRAIRLPSSRSGKRRSSSMQRAVYSAAVLCPLYCAVHAGTSAMVSSLRTSGLRAT
jgi:hypothetical protein